MAEPRLILSRIDLEASSPQTQSGAVVRLHFECCAQCWDPPCQKDAEVLQSIQRGAAELWRSHCPVGEGMARRDVTQSGFSNGDVLTAALPALSLRPSGLGLPVLLQDGDKPPPDPLPEHNKLNLPPMRDELQREERPRRAAASHPPSPKDSAEGFCLLGA